MAEETDEGEHDNDFSQYLERAIPKSMSLSALIQAEVKKALLSFAPNNSNPEPMPTNSGSYLERQNALLLSQMLRRGRPSAPPVPLAVPDLEEEEDLPVEVLSVRSPMPRAASPKVKPVSVLAPDNKPKPGAYWR
jgi:hypothetical protein